LPDLFCQFLSGFEAGIPLSSYLYRLSSTRVPPLPGFLVLYGGLSPNRRKFREVSFRSFSVQTFHNLA
jgi:hypothetical protein